MKFMILPLLLTGGILFFHQMGKSFPQKDSSPSIAAKSLSSKTAPTELVIYTSRKEHLIRPVFKAFEKEHSGQVKIKYFTDEAGVLLQKLMIEKESSRADILMTVDVGNLHQAQKKGLFDKWESEKLKRKIPSYLRDGQGYWYGFSLRARTIFYNKKKVSHKDLLDYVSLSQPKWKGRLCLRTSKKVYNQSLVASLIYHYGAEETERVLKGWVKNLAASVFSSDTKLLEAIDRGVCDVGIANSYYYGRLLKKNKAQNVKVFWPKASRHGVHVNISGAGVLKNSQNKKWARLFLEWLSSQKAQKLFAELNLEYPSVKKTPLDEIVKSFGPFQSDQINLIEVGKRQVQAIKLMDRVGYR